MIVLQCFEWFSFVYYICADRRLKYYFVVPCSVDFCSLLLPLEFDCNPLSILVFFVMSGLLVVKRGMKLCLPMVTPKYCFFLILCVSYLLLFCMDSMICVIAFSVFLIVAPISYLGIQRVCHQSNILQKDFPLVLESNDPRMDPCGTVK